MPSPFPGMDPYLEGFGWWKTVHARTVAAINDALNAALPDAYVASIEERFIFTEVKKGISPDVTIHRVSEAAAAYGVLKKRIVEPISITASIEEERQTYLRIVRTADQSEVIVEIELLSPTNKTPGDSARELYLEKQSMILDSRAHLVEIDLLRAGTHTIACPKTYLRELNPWHYLICLHEARAGQTYQVWPISLREQLPCFRIPLENPGEHVELDLQAALNQSYDVCAFAKRIKYALPPEPPLSAEDAAWANELLKQRNLR